MLVTCAALGACGGGESPRLGGDGGVDAPGDFVFTASGTRGGTPFAISGPCFSRLENNGGTVETFDSDLQLGFMVIWERGAVAMTYPNDNFNPEVLVIHISTTTTSTRAASRGRSRSTSSATRSGPRSPVASTTSCWISWRVASTLPERFAASSDAVA